MTVQNAASLMQLTGEAQLWKTTTFVSLLQSIPATLLAGAKSASPVLAVGENAEQHS